MNETKQAAPKRALFNGFISSVYFLVVGPCLIALIVLPWLLRRHGQTYAPDFKTLLAYYLCVFCLFVLWIAFFMKIIDWRHPYIDGKNDD